MFLLYLLGEQVTAINPDLHILDNKILYEELEQYFQDWYFQVGQVVARFYQTIL